MCAIVIVDSFIVGISLKFCSRAIQYVQFQNGLCLQKIFLLFGWFFTFLMRQRMQNPTIADLGVKIENRRKTVHRSRRKDKLYLPSFLLW